MSYFTIPWNYLITYKKKINKNKEKTNDKENVNESEYIPYFSPIQGNNIKIKQINYDENKNKI